MKLLITRPIPDEGLKMLKKFRSLKIDLYEKDQPIPRKELLARAKDADIILSILTDKIDAEVMDAAGPSLKLIANYAVGFNNIDIEEAKSRGIKVTNAPGKEISDTVAEHVIALMFGLAHRIVETDAFTREGKYEAWGPQLFLGTDIRKKTLGIIGTGAIGSELARMARHGHNMNIIYNDIERNPKLEKEVKAKFRTKEALLKEADFVSLHVPLLPATKHLISTKELKQMKKTAFLINTSRGPVVDEIALVKALEQNQIAGAGLDVYECEPFIDCNPNDTHELRKLKNVILTPHTASATIETRQAMSRATAKNIIAFLGKKRLPNKIV